MFLFATLKFVPHKKGAANKITKTKYTMPQELITRFENAMDETVNLISSLSEEKLNTVPFKDSWTAAQVAQHLYKAEKNLDQLFLAPAEPVNRPPDANAQNLKAMMLDFENKMNAPAFLIPEDKKYNKEQLINSLKEVKERIIPTINKNDLNCSAPLPEGHPLTGNTKLEILHFMIYHTVRHNHQIQKITEVLQ